jgi:hypothetical protein
VAAIAAALLLLAPPRAGATSGSWSIVSSPNTSSTNYKLLESVACPSSTDCWAVGYYNKGTPQVADDQTLVERDTGSGWNIVN